jgi:hypothetical protein
MVGNIVRVTSPSRSNPRNVKVSIRCEMLAIDRRSSLNRLGLSPSDDDGDIDPSHVWPHFELPSDTEAK